MSAPKRGSGFRPIIVNDIQFRWQFAPGESSSLFIAYSGGSTGPRLEVALLGWRDPWLQSASAAGIIHNEPAVVTNRFARAAILEALARGYLQQGAGQKLCLQYRDGVFSAKE